MFALYILGTLLEPAIGAPRFVALYMAALLGGSAGALIAQPDATTVGASGAIFGLFAATFLIARARGMREVSSQIGFWLLINLALTVSIPQISLGGHLGGMTVGALCGLVVAAGERSRAGSRVAFELLVMTVLAAASVAVALLGRLTALPSGWANGGMRYMTGRDRARLAFAARPDPDAERREDVDTARLVTQAQGGDSDAFATLYSRYLARVLSYMLVVLGDQNEAEDAAQSVFAKALEALPTYVQHEQPFRGWLFRISRNHAVDQLRRIARIMPIDPAELRELQEEQASEEEDYLRSVLESISDSDLSLFLDRLSLPQRQVILLRFTADFTTAEIAQVLHRSAADVRMLQSRALHFLRTRLNALGRRAELAEGAAEGGEKIQMRRLPQEAPVLRSRKWSLRSSAAPFGIRRVHFSLFPSANCDITFFKAICFMSYESRAAHQTGARAGRPDTGRAGASPCDQSVHGGAAGGRTRQSHR